MSCFFRFCALEQFEIRALLAADIPVAEIQIEIAAFGRMVMNQHGYLDPNQLGENGEGGDDAIVASLDKAIDEINQQTGLELKYNGIQDGEAIGVGPNPAQQKVYIVALGLDGPRGRIAEYRGDGIIVIDKDDLAEVSRGYMDDLIAHELGHSLHLSHLTDRGSVMYPSIQALNGFQEQDIYALQELYGGVASKKQAPLAINAQEQFHGTLLEDKPVNQFVFRPDVDGQYQIGLWDPSIQYNWQSSQDLRIVFHGPNGDQTINDKAIGKSESYSFDAKAGTEYRFDIAGTPGGPQPYGLSVSPDNDPTIIHMQIASTLDLPATSEQMGLRKAVQLSNDRWFQEISFFLGKGEFRLDHGALDIQGRIELVGDSPQTTFIDAQSLSRIAEITTTGDLTLRNLTIRGGKSNADGGAILGGVSNNLTLINVVITDCSAAGSGGAINVSGDVTARNSVFSNNHSGNRGGAIALVQGTIQLLQLFDCVVDGNNAKYGGGIYSDSQIQLTNCIVRNNHATQNGGGIDCEGFFGIVLSNCDVNSNDAAYGGGIFSNGLTQLTNCAIRNNQATQNGGGINSMERLTLSECVIEGNSASYGGGIDLSGIQSSIDDNVIKSNIATKAGGGVRVNGLAAGLSLNGTIFDSNRAGTEGGGVFASVDIDGRGIADCTFVNNSAQQVGGAIAAYDGLAIQRTSIIDNSAARTGGVWVSSENVTIVQSTFFENESIQSGAQLSLTGFNRIQRCTIANGRGKSLGVEILGSGSNLVFDSIVAGNAAFPDIKGGFSSSSGNVYGRLLPESLSNLRYKDKSGTESQPLDAKLGTVAFRGGLTPTISLLPDSPAIENAWSQSKDQRGIGPFDGNGDGQADSDSGATEYVADDIPFPTIVTNLSALSAGVGAFALTLKIDGAKVDPASLGNDDIKILGPMGQWLRTEFVRSEDVNGGSVLTYSVFSPEESWETSDSGASAIYVSPSQIKLLDGRMVRDGLIGFPELKFVNSGTTIVRNLVVPSTVSQDSQFVAVASNIDFGTSPSQVGVGFGITSQNLNNGTLDPKLVTWMGSCTPSESCHAAASDSWSRQIDTNGLALGDYSVIAMVGDLDTSHQFAHKSFKVVPKVKIDDAVVQEPQLGTSEMVFHITVPSAAQAYQIYVSTGTSANSPATEGQDYMARTRIPITILPGQTQASFSVRVFSDSIDESDEFLTVFAEDASKRVISNTAIGKIIDDPDARWGTKIIRITRQSETGGTRTTVQQNPQPITAPTVRVIGSNSSSEVQSSLQSGLTQFTIPSGSSSNHFLFSQANQEASLVSTDQFYTVAPHIQRSKDGMLVVVESEGILRDARGASIIYVANGGSVILPNADGKTIVVESRGSVYTQSGKPNIFAEPNANIPKNANTVSMQKVQILIDSLLQTPPVVTFGSIVPRVQSSEAVFFDAPSTSSTLDDVFATYDVNNDGGISPLDVLIIINAINSEIAGQQTDNALSLLGRTDIDQDGFQSPLDVLRLVNYINRLA